MVVTLILITVPAGYVLSLALIFHSSLKSELQRRSALSKEEKPSGLPMRLKIPRIDVDSAIEHVGLTPDGAMDIPKSPLNVGWFQIGAPPGENGSAVIAGHYGWKNGRVAAFDSLYALRTGDKIYVEDDRGFITIFAVRESRRYDPNADASTVFGSDDGAPHLNLITCEGVWNADQKSYSGRLVVFSDKVY